MAIKKQNESVYDINWLSSNNDIKLVKKKDVYVWAKPYNFLRGDTLSAVRSYFRRTSSYEPTEKNIEKVYSGEKTMFHGDVMSGIVFENISIRPEVYVENYTITPTPSTSFPITIDKDYTITAIGGTIIAPSVTSSSSSYVTFRNTNGFTVRYEAYWRDLGTGTNYPIQTGSLAASGSKTLYYIQGPSATVRVFIKFYYGTYLQGVATTALGPYTWDGTTVYEPYSPPEKPILSNLIYTQDGTAQFCVKINDTTLSGPQYTLYVVITSQKKGVFTWSQGGVWGGGQVTCGYKNIGTTSTDQDTITIEAYYVVDGNTSRHSDESSLTKPFISIPEIEEDYTDWENNVLVETCDKKGNYLIILGDNMNFFGQREEDTLCLSLISNTTISGSISCSFFGMTKYITSYDYYKNRFQSEDGTSLEFPYASKEITLTANETIVVEFPFVDIYERFLEALYSFVFPEDESENNMWRSIDWHEIPLFECLGFRFTPNNNNNNNVNITTNAPVSFSIGPIIPNEVDYMTTWKTIEDGVKYNIFQEIQNTIETRFDTDDFCSGRYRIILEIDKGNANFLNFSLFTSWSGVANTLYAFEVTTETHEVDLTNIPITNAILYEYGKSSTGSTDFANYLDQIEFTGSGGYYRIKAYYWWNIR